MKYTLKNILGAIAFIGLSAISLTSCYETHYYHQYHHHTREWYGHRNAPPPAGVDFNVDVRR
jgi:hypothetical protein